MESKYEWIRSVGRFFTTWSCNMQFGLWGNSKWNKKWMQYVENKIGLFLGDIFYKLND